MSGVILSTIFDFGLEAKLRLLQEEAAGILKKKIKDGNTEDEEDGTEVRRPEIRWLKSGPPEKDDETGSAFISSTIEPDSGEGEESIDSDSDTITPECEDYEDEEEEGGYYDEEQGERENNGPRIFEWEMTTILEEPEEEEAAEDEERMQFGESAASAVGPRGFELAWKEHRTGESGGCSDEERGMAVAAALGTGADAASAQEETGISTEEREAEEESGTPAEEKGSWSSSTSVEDHHDSPSPDFLLQNHSAECTHSPESGTSCVVVVQEPIEVLDIDLCRDLGRSELEEGKAEGGGEENGGDLIQEELAEVEQVESPDDVVPDEIPEIAAGEEKGNNTESPGVETEGMHTAQHQRLLVINNNGTESRLLRSVLRKPGNSKGRKGRCVTFNESLNLFYDAECSCWVHEDDYARFRQEEFERREREEMYHYEPLPLPVEYDEPPTLSPPEGYKDRFFPQEFHGDPDVTRVSPPSPPTARRKVFLRDPAGLTNGQDEEVEEETNKKKGLRLGGILKGGRLWRSNSSDGKKVVSPPEEPDVVKCTESSSIQMTNSYSTSTNTYDGDASTTQGPPTKVSIGTAPLRTSEQIRLAVDSTLRSRKNKKPECSTLVEKLRWLTSLEDEDSDSNQSGFATWPSPRDKNGLPLPASSSSPGNSTRKSDAGTSTSEEHFVETSMRMPSGNVHEAKIKQISYTLEDIEDGLKGTELELEKFITKDGARIERIRKRYGEEGDDYGFSRRPSVKGIKPKFSSTNQIFAQFTNRKMESPAMGMSTNHQNEYENTRLPPQNSTGQPPPPPPPPAMSMSAESHQIDPNAARTSLSYEFQNMTPGRQTDESRAHFEMIRQSFETATAGGAPNFITNYHNRPHSWSVSTLPHPHHNSTLPFNHLVTTGAQQPPQNQPVYGTVRRIPNLIGRPLFLHYSAMSVEAHPSKIPQIPQQPAAPSSASSQHKVPETPSPTQQTPILPIPMGMSYYGPPIRPPIRYYNQPPPVPPRTSTAPQGGGVIVSAPAPIGIGINNLNNPHNSHPHVNVMMNERGVPEGATDEEHLQHKEAYSMNV